MENKKVVMIGAGNVATHLSAALYSEGYDIVQIFSRTMRSAVELASKFESSFTTEIEEINKEADIYFICVTDTAIRSLLLTLPFKDKLLLHTAGSVHISVFEDCDYEKYGVFYPLQTFSKFRPVNFHEIPIFIEVNREEDYEQVYAIARSISPFVYRRESEQRMRLHLSAVFACNFSNHMMGIAEELLKKDKLSFDILKPMIRETFEKAMKFSPSQSQTGPAVRNDKIVVTKHIEMLENSELFREIYESVSKSIWDFKQKSNG